MVVIETKIPIVAVQHHEAQASSPASNDSRNRIKFDCIRRYIDRKVPIRAISLYDGSEYDAFDSTSHMPEQLRDVMTYGMYYEFCIKLNECIRDHDIASRYCYKYVELYAEIFQLAAVLTVFVVAVLSGASLARSTSNDAVAALYIFLFSIFGSIVAFITMVSFLLLYYRSFNKEITKYTSLQKSAYARIQRECDALSKDISTSSVAITFYLGCDNTGNNKNNQYYDWQSHKMLKTTNFDHIIVTSTDLIPAAICHTENR
jgi:hypothetical protein